MDKFAALELKLKKLAGGRWDYPHLYNKRDFVILTNKLGDFVDEIRRKATGMFFKSSIIDEFIAKKWWPKKLPGFEDSGELIKELLFHEINLARSIRQIKSDSFFNKINETNNKVKELLEKINTTLPDEDKEA